MWVYLLLIVFVFILLIISMIYIIKFLNKTLKKYIKNKIVVRTISLIPLFLLFIGLLIDMVNVIVIVIHLIIITLFLKLLNFVFYKYTKKQIGEFAILVVGVIITSLILIQAYYQAYHVSKTHYDVYTNKNLGVDNFRIVQISDSHLGTTMTGKEFSKYMEQINELNPDIVVITGDYIDDNTSDIDLVDASLGLGSLKTKYGVYFSFGNHDKGYYGNKKESMLRCELSKNNVIILEDKSVNIGEYITLIGRQDREVKDRMDAVSLVKELDKNKYLIMLDHQPNDYNNEKNAKVDLVLSGHTHGGQLIPLGFFGLLFGSNDKVYGIEKRDDTIFIVNSGISDWAIKFKTGTKSEYVVVDIQMN